MTTAATLVAADDPIVIAPDGAVPTHELSLAARGLINLYVEICHERGYSTVDELSRHGRAGRLEIVKLVDELERGGFAWTGEHARWLIRAAEKPSPLALDPLAEELGDALADGSPLPAREREVLRTVVERMLAPYRAAARKRRVREESAFDNSDIGAVANGGVKHADEIPGERFGDRPGAGFTTQPIIIQRDRASADWKSRSRACRSSSARLMPSLSSSVWTKSAHSARDGFQVWISSPLGAAAVGRVIAATFQGLGGFPGPAPEG